LPVRDLHNNINVRPALNPVIATTDNTVYTTSILDTLGFEGIELVLQTGTLADADATFTVAMTQSNDPAMAGAIAVSQAQDGGDTLGLLTQASFTFANDNQCFKIGYSGIYRYIQATVTPANNTGSAQITGVWVMGYPALVPTANPPV
jgi:hypothetical protein